MKDDRLYVQELSNFFLERSILSKQSVQTLMTYRVLHCLLKYVFRGFNSSKGSVSREPFSLFHHSVLT